MASIAAHMRDSISDLRLPVVTLLLVVFHLVGIIGLHSAHYSFWFERIAWLNMLVSFILVASMYRSWQGLHVLFIAAGVAISLACEIIGVQKGILFGSYHYEKIAGPWLWGVPIVIGINWVLLTICSGTLMSALFHSSWARVLSAAVLMVLIDILLESFAIHHHLWVWHQDNVPPLLNFVTWGAVSVVLQLLYTALWRDGGNKVAIIYLLVLFVFLLADRLFSHDGIHTGALTGPYHFISFDHVVNSIV